MVEAPRGLMIGGHYQQGPGQKVEFLEPNKNWNPRLGAAWQELELIGF